MAQIGNSSATGGTYTDGFSNRQFWSSYTMPSPGGYITDYYVYVGPTGASATVQPIVWANSAISLNAGNHNVTSSQWIHVTVNAPQPYIAGGTTVSIGFWCGADGISRVAGSGSTPIANEETGVSSASSLGSSSQSGSGPMAAYLLYTVLTAPTISNATPNPVTPGGTLTVTGTGFLHASSVSLGGSSCSFSITSDTSMTVTVPSSGVSGAVNLTVTNPAGTSSPYSVTVGQIWIAPSGTVIEPVAIWCNPGSGPAKVLGVWVNNGSGGVKRIW